MAQCWAYAAPLPANGKLNWGGDWSGNIPRTGMLPDLPRQAFDEICQLARLGVYDRKQLDWGATAIIVDAAALRNVIGQIFAASATRLEASHHNNRNRGMAQPVKAIANMTVAKRDWVGLSFIRSLGTQACPKR